jgi:hypothetical protein
VIVLACVRCCGEKADQDQRKAENEKKSSPHVPTSKMHRSAFILQQASA